VATTGDKLIVLDGRVTDEKLAELLDLQTEHPQLDFKKVIDLTTTAGVVELAKDVGAFQVAGGYIVIGVDGHGVPTGDMDGCDPQHFDSANLVPKLSQFLPEPLTIHSRVVEWKSHTVVILFIAPHPEGYAVFKAVGQYPKPGGRSGEMKVIFREGEVFWREGTRSVRISQQGLREVIERRIAAARAEWMLEQQEMRRREREEIEAGYAGRDLAKAPLGTMNLGASAEELRIAVLELIRANDTVGLLYLLNDARPRAMTAIQRDEIETELSALLNKLAAIGAVALEFEQDDLLTRVIGVFAQVYSLPVQDDRAMSRSVAINPEAKAPRVFLEVLERVYALGGLAVRLRRWEAVRELTLQFPEGLDDYWKNWLRHGLTMASRAQRFTQEREDGQKVEVSLLTLAAQVIEQEPALHPDTDDDDSILTSIAQFDFLSNLAAIDGAGSVDSAVYYTNWARFDQQRIQPVADRVITDPAVRQAIFRDHGDDDLAHAFREVGQEGGREGIRYLGFWGWDRTPVGDFLAEHPPPAAV
jgi:Schlafen, AlbA_2